MKVMKRNLISKVLVLRFVLFATLFCGVSFAKAQDITPVNLDVKISQLQKDGSKAESDKLRKLYYDLNPTIFIKGDNSAPVIVGKGKATVLNVHASKLRGLNVGDISNVKMLIVDFQGISQLGGYQLTAVDLAKLTSLEYVLIVSDGSLNATSVKTLFSNTGYDKDFVILFKSLSEIN